MVGTDPSPVLRDIRELCTASGVPLREVGRGRFGAAARCDAPQGVLARAAPIEGVEIEELLGDGVSGRAPLVVVADGITDPGNLGALLRSAECSGASGVVLGRHRAVHVTPTVAKAAAGAVEHLAFSVVGGLPAAMARLGELGCLRLGLDPGGGTGLWSLPPVDGPVAVALGAEGSGLSRLVRARCDAVVSIPSLGHLDSLNVASAGAVVLFEIARRRDTR